MTHAVLSVASEFFPVVKTGGLADVAAALPAALAGEDFAVTTLLPGYPAVMAALRDRAELYYFAKLAEGPARLWRGRIGPRDVAVLEADHLFARTGGPYQDVTGRDWPDNWRRFAALAWVGCELACGRAGAYAADLVQAHDWQAALTPAYLHYAGGPPSVMTLHNLAFQGQFAPEVFPLLGLPPAAWSVEGVEYYGGVGYLKAGILFADAVTTVSPTYAAEIRTEAGGMGLGGLLRGRGRRLMGILNGLDTGVWNPATDSLLAHTYTARNRTHPHMGRAACKAALQERMGLEPDPEALLFGVVSRLSWQKGLDLLLGALPVLLESGAQLALVGSGDAALRDGFLAAAAAHPGRVGCFIGYDEKLAHAMMGGADAVLVPSRFEPCGLTQLSALRYGALPVVARVGGLADTVIDANEMALSAGAGTGVMFSPPDQTMLETALARTAALWADRKQWTRLQGNAMRTDVSWKHPAARYAALFRELIADRTTAGSTPVGSTPVGSTTASSTTAGSTTAGSTIAGGTIAGDTIAGGTTGGEAA